MSLLSIDLVGSCHEPAFSRRELHKGTTRKSPSDSIDSKFDFSTEF